MAFNIVNNTFKQLDDWSTLFEEGTDYDEAYKKSGLSKAVREYITNLQTAKGGTVELTAETMTFAEKSKLVTTVLKEQALVLATPFGQVAVVADAIFIVLKAVKGLFYCTT